MTKERGNAEGSIPKGRKRNTALPLIAPCLLFRLPDPAVFRATVRPGHHGKVDEMIEEHERRDFFETVTDEVALSRWLRRRIDEMKKLARELESAEDFMFDCVLRAESDDGQQQLPGVEKISPAKRGLDLLRIGTRKVRDAINDARKPPNFAEERLKVLAEKIRAASGAAQ